VLRGAAAVAPEQARDGRERALVADIDGTLEDLRVRLARFSLPQIEGDAVRVGRLRRRTDRRPLESAMVGLSSAASD